jgi:hypothetical protein
MKSKHRHFQYCERFVGAILDGLGFLYLNKIPYFMKEINKCIDSQVSPHIITELTIKIQSPISFIDTGITHNLTIELADLK